MLKRTTARGILFMHNSRGEKCIALIKRIKSNQPEYYVVPGGGVEGNETVFQNNDTFLRKWRRKKQD